jgi:hypothetical protein
MAALSHRVMPYMTIIARDLIWHTMQYDLKQILTSGSSSSCLGEIGKIQIPELPVSNILTVISVNMDQPGCQMIFVCELTIVIPRLQCLLRMAKAVSSTVELLNSVTSDSVNVLYFAM